ncbi:MAG: hypothetical protein KDC95_18360 [Planctomycetes bacterium]|nr:hypothetical protein [Planctomycetota bacterium]
MTFGGHDGTNDVDDTYELRGNVWADRTTTSQPTARVGAAMSYDSQRRTVVLNGGFALLLSWNDTVEWDGTSWTWRSPLNRPTPLSHHRLSFDSARNRTVLFGGYSKRTYPSTVSNETWEWDGTNWKYALTANRPPARAEFGMAFDPVRRRVVVFGGQDSTAEFGDTWEYDGANWMQVTPTTSPLSRWGCSMTFDPTRNRIVMHGGQRRSGSTIQLLTDTWDFDGTTWRQLATTGSAVRGEGNITYDTRAGCLVMVESRGVVNRLGIAGSVTALGTGCVSSGSIPRLSANAPWIGTERLSYDMMSTLPSTPCIYGISPRSQNLGLGSGCSLYVVFPLLTFGTVTNSAGFAESSFPLPFDPSLRGVTYHTQAFALDAASPVLGLAFTNAVQTVIGN